ncbi:Ankyrin [Plasmopara halstedii]|uniref:Ankyrin n=1 Tax=Plasmopara halstedii TaxID=4781 RepID=A0A0P1AJ96_PLAHL|nr:Ankyrin [Plasmopara halstedii]CEG40864.1 Ankyrin [Plasmopara halstedii]|eukprot:XP_024577233.1 Ankyrin [Plasmopara halstedii]
MALVEQCTSPYLEDVNPPLTTLEGSDSREGTQSSSDDEENVHRNSVIRPPMTPLRSSKANADEVFVRNMLGLLNKRGYNVRDAAVETSIASSSPSCTRTSSITSTGSTLSSVLLALREPNHGQTPLHIAVRKGDVQVLEALLEHESIEELLHAPDFNGNTALHFATGNWRQSTCLTITERLLEAGAKVQAMNKRGLTPLAVHMLTLKIDNPTVILKLLEAGADANTEVESIAILHLAVRRQLPVIAGVLVSYGASMLQLNADGLMCYEVASSRVKQFMVRSLRKAPIYLSMTQRSACMRCNSPTLLTMKRIVGNMLKKVMGLTCLKPSNAVSAIPFVREDEDPNAKIKTCRLCEAILVEKKKKQAAVHAFDMHRMGLHTTL